MSWIRFVSFNRLLERLVSGSRFWVESIRLVSLDKFICWIVFISRRARLSETVRIFLVENICILIWKFKNFHWDISIIKYLKQNEYLQYIWLVMNNWLSLSNNLSSICSSWQTSRFCRISLELLQEPKSSSYQITRRQKL